MNIQLNLPLDVVNLTINALGQVQSGAQNAMAMISEQARVQLQQPDVVDVTDQKVGGTD